MFKLIKFIIPELQFIFYYFEKWYRQSQYKLIFVTCKNNTENDLKFSTILNILKKLGKSY